MIDGYRKDIDGLRAIAVLAVIAFHAQWVVFQGGFIGVDVFFVISGYLMGSIVIEDVCVGKFSIASFYERRIRRIFPALAVMMLVTSVLAYFFLLPSELGQYGKSLVAATFSFSNLYFNRTQDYFSADFLTMPLLHTWSLAIEEQFYLIFPVFVIFAYRLSAAKFSLFLLAATLISFVFSAYGAFATPTSAFYLLHSRAWELLIGAVISMSWFPHLRTPVWRNAASATGLALIIVAAVGFSPSTTFPGFAALVPCVGSALVIIAGRSGASRVGSALSTWPLVFLGQISYSLYLWHWPVFVFVKMSELVPTANHPVIERILAVFATVIIATISWKFVESPFRRKIRRPLRTQVFVFAGVTAAVLLAIGTGATVSQGFASRFSLQANTIAAYLTRAEYGKMRGGTCLLLVPDKWVNFDFTDCLTTDARKDDYLIFGDSHAAQLWYGLASVFPEYNFMQATVSSCQPIVDHEGDARCNDLLKYMFSDYLLHNSVDGVILAAHWREWAVDALPSTLDWFVVHGIRVILVGPIVQYDDALPRLLAFSEKRNDALLPEHHRLDLRDLDKAMRQMAESRGIPYISLYQALCEGESCDLLGSTGAPLLFDESHLTRDGSVLVAQRLRELHLFPKPVISQVSH